MDLKPGRVGQFDVVVAGRLLFSKKQTGRFPGPGEVEERLVQFKAGKEFPEAPERRSNGGIMARIISIFRP
ncbi:MAG: Rdx family protein [Candidatus Binataceae bacterium]